MTTKSKKLSQQLREAILKASMSRYQLAKESGVGEGSLSRFVHRQQSLTLDSVDAIGEVLGLQIVTKAKHQKRK